MAAYLIITEGSGLKRTILIDQVDAISIGRDSGCNIAVSDIKASRKHCTIVADESGCRVIDHGSRNGTYVNDAKVAESCALNAGDLIRLGDCVIQLVKELPQEGDAQPPKPKVGTQRSTWGKSLVYRVMCPNCWQQFFPEEMRFVAKHPELLGDPVLGSNEYLRFEPKRFTPRGEALDPKGVPTADLACPRCHLPVVQPMLEMPPLFISLIGSPASGKSYYLATMTWELRRLLPRAAVSFTDADPAANACVNDYERTLFLNPETNKPTAIRKTTQFDSLLHRNVTINGVTVRLPIPLQFILQPTSEHPKAHLQDRPGRMLIMYDNAGEDFRPGIEVAESAAVQHLAASNVLLMLYDLAQDPRFVAVTRSQDPQLHHGLRPEMDQPLVVERQETILREASVRLRRYLGVSQDKRLNRPLIVVIPKFDIWQEMAGVSIETEPYIEGNGGMLLVDTERVEQASNLLRALLARYAPEFAATAENLSSIVRYIPVSSLGCSPSLIRSRGKKGFYGILPRDVQPKWVTVPLLYSLCKWSPGIVFGKPKAAERSAG